MVMLVLVAVFVGGLMVGHTPQYLGKQLSIRETRLIGAYMVLGMATALPLTALAVATAAGRAGLVTNQGAHGLTEILFAYSSSLANNGQNFAGLNANSPFYNLTTAIEMIVGRFGLAALALGLAGSFAQQRLKPESVGTLPTDSMTFFCLLTGTILVLAGLSYFPALSLGPIVEHLIMIGG
jgi:potassium-transporting ATPase potassium-binding subunit